MSVTIRNWGSFPSPIGELSATALDLTAQGRASLAALLANLPEQFGLYPPATDRGTLFFREDEGADLLRLDGRFRDGSGRVEAMTYYDDVVYDGTTPVAGERYHLSGGRARFDAEGGLSGYFRDVEFTDYSEGYSASLRGKFFAASGTGSFDTADLRLEDGSGYRLRGDIRFATDDGPAFDGTVRSLDIFAAGGERVATARGLKIDAGDFGDGPGSFADAVIFAGNDNVTLGDDGVFFDAWAGKDRVKGGSGNDTIDGGEGRDVLTGGGGEDVFLFSAAESVLGSYARDEITDFRAADDRLVLDTDVFVALADADYYDPGTGDFVYGAAAADGVLVYARGVLYYDADGSAGAD
ncbi:MAG: calcium-binding protein, partial [Rhodocyclaceae bacterium]|nr:calcium-binding protein [Rhodocyclaceae bacterium]